jgi:hypothetical protein
MRLHGAALPHFNLLHALHDTAAIPWTLKLESILKSGLGFAALSTTPKPTVLLLKKVHGAK